jgi:predicted sulfurtransferase
MRSLSVYPLLIILAAIILVGCNSASSKDTKIAQNGNQKTGPEVTYPDGARRITIAELQEAIKKNEAYIIDVRNEASYNAGHIHGARLIPATEILNHVNELPKDKLIVTYCS